MIHAWHPARAFTLAAALLMGPAGCAQRPQSRDRVAARSSALEVTHTIDAIGDTYLRSGSPNQNQGSEPTVRLQSSGKNRGLLFFDRAAIQGAVGGRTLASATLELAIASAPSNWGATGRAIAAHRLLQASSEYAATWSCASDGSIYNSQPDCLVAAGTAWDMDATSTADNPWLQTATATALVEPRAIS